MASVKPSQLVHSVHAYLVAASYPKAAKALKKEALLDEAGGDVLVELAVACKTWAKKHPEASADDLPRSVHAFLGACQLAKSAKALKKEAAVDGPSRDIVHAYQHVCRQCTRAGPVLILEDDATLMPDAAAHHFAAADRFLASRPFHVYSLGSLGPYVSFGVHPRYACFVGFLQAAVYSEHARACIAQADVARVKHVDAHVVSRLPGKRTYYRPLVVQPFEETDNMQEWGCSRREHTP